MSRRPCYRNPWALVVPSLCVVVAIAVVFAIGWPTDGGRLVWLLVALVAGVALLIILIFLFAGRLWVVEDDVAAWTSTYAAVIDEIQTKMDQHIALCGLTHPGIDMDAALFQITHPRSA